MNDIPRLLTEELVLNQIRTETLNEDKSLRDFQEYADKWWKEYKQFRESHRKRLVPIFVNTDDRTFM